MTPPSTPVQRVVEALERAGYRSLPTPLSVATVPFEFPAILVGPERTPELIVIVDTVVESEIRIRQKVEALSRALDVSRSRRPLTVIVAGPHPHAATIEALARVSRVLPVGTPVGAAADEAVQNALAVLLPLTVRQTTEAATDVVGELRARIKGVIDDPVADSLMQAAAGGSEGVERAFRALLVDSLSSSEGAE